MGFQDDMKFDDKGLLTAIVQDWKTGEVLMCAFMNKEALARTMEQKLAHFYSRSRQKLWCKGETSGHTQEVKKLYIDCDADAVLVKVKQNGGACHMGYRSCFYRKVEGDGSLTVTGEKVFDPDKVY